MTDRYTIRARFRGAHGEAVDFASDDRTVRVDFDAEGWGTVKGKEATGKDADVVRAFDPDGRHYVVAPIDDTPIEPAKAPTKKGS